MTEDELAAELARIKVLQVQINAAIHDLLNGLAIIKAEIDLAIDHARQLVTRFYDRFPELKESHDGPQSRPE